MAVAAIVGGTMTYSWACLVLFLVSTGVALLFGATLGIHRKLSHDSLQCPRWLGSDKDARPRELGTSGD